MVVLMVGVKGRKLVGKLVLMTVYRTVVTMDVLKVAEMDVVLVEKTAVMRVVMRVVMMVDL